MGVKNTQTNTRGPFEGVPSSNYVSGKDRGFHSQFYGDATPGGITYGDPEGHVATGGIIKDYYDNTPDFNAWRAHIFTGDGTFTITSLSPKYGATVEYLLVGGGGGGGARHGGGGGAGGLVSNHPDMPAPMKQPVQPVSATSYPITIGMGGVYGNGPSSNTDAYGVPGGPGRPSTAFGKIAEGGGAGTGYPAPSKPGVPGGSGGGGMHQDSSTYGDGGIGNRIVGTSSGAAITTQGNPGGAGGPAGTPHYAGGGGGAGGAGSPSDDGGSSAAAPGGDGLVINIVGPSTLPATVRTYAAGGGGGGQTGGTGGSGGIGGPGGGTDDANGGNGLQSTGSGGGGARTPSGADGGAGANGICIIRYQIGKSKEAADEISTTGKATGGDISFYSTKTIHTFRSSGTFTLPAGEGAKTCQILCVGGGGSGGSRHGGGGGGGGVLHMPSGTVNPGTYNVVVGGGGITGNGESDGSSGSDTTFGPPTSASVPSHLIAKGGGCGGKYPGNTGVAAGGCGGGGDGSGGSSGGSSDQPNPGAFGTSYGYAYAGGGGSTGPAPSVPDPRLGGGGGGAGESGHDAGGHPFGTDSGAGGAGKQIQIAGDPNHNFYYGGGGGGGAWGQASGYCHPNYHAGQGGEGGGGGGGSSCQTTPGYDPWMDPSQDITNGSAGAARTGGLVNGSPGTMSGTNIGGTHSNKGGSGGMNSGGGGGGNGQSDWSDYGSNLCTGGNGGSGVVIIAYDT